MTGFFIYGARSLALGISTAIQILYPKFPVQGFLVTSLADNASTLAGLPVREIGEFAACCSKEEKQHCHILIATPEDMHPEIVAILEQYGFFHYTCMDSRREARLMERYFAQIGRFKALHSLPMGPDRVNITIFAARSHRDKAMIQPYDLPEWVVPLQVGNSLTDQRVAKLADSTGENISAKNRNYCELTGLYWVWKNILSAVERTDDDYFGLFHYRRILDITEYDLCRLKENKVDVVLQFPTLHEPNISEHHTRYVSESDWKAVEQALRELYPEYARAFPDIFSQPYFYNYNLILSKRQVLTDYCAWLFPILERVEELSVPQGAERADRYIGYLGENLMTLYFLYHAEDLNIFHTGRFMLV